MVFLLRGGVPLDLFVLLGRKGNPRSEQGFSFLPKTHLPFLALPKGSALWNPGLVLRRGCFDQSFYARLHSKRGRVSRPARSVLLVPLEASCSPRSKRVARPARSELLAPLGASCSPRSKRVARLARSVLLPSPVGRYSLRP